MDAAMLGDRMRKLLKKAFVATQVEATLIAPKELFWYEGIEVSGAPVGLQAGAHDATTTTKDESGPPENASRLHKEIGNVFRNTVITFRYGIRHDSQLDEHARIPFQVSSCSAFIISSFIYSGYIPTSQPLLIHV